MCTRQETMAVRQGVQRRIRFLRKIMEKSKVYGVINKNGAIAFEIKDGAFNREFFFSFITDKLFYYFRENPNSILIG